MGLLLSCLCAEGADAAERPNIVLILCDDLGYGDLACFGSDRIKTPNIDRMAATGMKFTDFYATEPICTPTRASIMTGCYPSRVGLGTPLHPPDKTGLNKNEITLAELLKSQGYATACIGKWHLGHHPAFYPTRHGFDYYYGTPLGHCFLTFNKESSEFSELFLRNEKKIPFPPMENLTEDLTGEAVQWIKANKNRPFFLFMSHPMPHGPVAASERFRGKSDGGLYGDAVETIDWSTGEIVKVIDELGLARDTIVVFTSDNGACRNDWGVEGASWFGSNAPFRGHKHQAWEGGLRVPCVMWGPGRVPAASVCSELATVMDFLPTFAAMAGAEVPADRTIDGKDIRALMTGEPGAESPYDDFIYHVRHGDIAGIRVGNWKLLVECDSSHWKHEGVALYNLERDPGEENNIAEEYPEKVEVLKARLRAFERELGRNTRPAGRRHNPRKSS